MSRKSIKRAIDDYQRSRLCFIQAMSSFADKIHTLQLLSDFDVLDLIMPLVRDRIPSIQHAALATLSKMICSKDVDIKQEVMDTDFIGLVFKNFDKQTKFYKKLALHMVSCVVQHDQRFATLIADNSGLDGIVLCLEDFDPGAREYAALALGELTKLSKTLAERATDQYSVMPVLVQILASPELLLKQAAAYAIENICKHDSRLAELAIDCGAVPLLIKSLNNEQDKLKAEAFLCLAVIAKHTPGYASIIAKDAVSIAVENLTHPVSMVQKNAASLLRDICRHNLRLSNLVVTAGGLKNLLNIANENNGCAPLPAIMALGYMAAQSEEFASEILAYDGIISLQNILRGNNKEQLKAAAAWTLSQIGKHSSQHTSALAESSVLSTLLYEVKWPEVSYYLRNRCKNALSVLISKCQNAVELERLFLGDIPEDLIPGVLCAFIKILPHDPLARRNFVLSNCLKKVQTLDVKPENKSYIIAINACFPTEVVQFMSPEYLGNLMDQLDTFYPQKSPFIPECRAFTPPNISSDTSPYSIHGM